MIEWSVSPEIFHIGPFSVRWYGLCFAISFLLGYYLLRGIMRQEKKPDSYLDQVFLYVFIGTIVGARLGHCLFYDPLYYLSNPIDILKVWQGGLASHGAAAGILSALYFYAKPKKDITFFWIVDRVVIVVALAGFFIRMGNLFNSEIYGLPTQVPWAFVFTRIDTLPRHPTQIYEALAYLTVFMVLYRMYQQKGKGIEEGLLFGSFLVGTFGFRFFVEYFKEVQSPWEAALPLNMGQLLSIPLVIAGILLIRHAKRSKSPAREKRPAKAAKR